LECKISRFCPAKSPDVALRLTKIPVVMQRDGQLHSVQARHCSKNWLLNTDYALAL
jgi:hypothetical protein